MSKRACDSWRRRLTSSLAFIALSGLGKAGLAQQPNVAWLEVTRDTAAEGCPTEEHLRRQIEPLLDGKEPAVPIHVLFTREPGTFVAEISRERQPGVRRLSDNHHDCRPLASAVATAIALLVDAEVPTTAIPPPTPEPPPDRTPPTRPEVPALPLERHIPSKRFVGLLGYFGPAWGLVAGTHPWLGGEAFLEIQRLRVGLGGAARLAGRSRLEPGQIRHRLTMATIRLCARALGNESLGLSGCSGLFGGRIDLKTSGFTEDGKTFRPFFAVPFEAHFAGRLPRTRGFTPGFRIGVTAIVPMTRDVFVVEGLDERLVTPRVAATVWAGFEGAFGW